MAEKEISEELGWKSWEEARQVAIKRREWRGIAESLSMCHLGTDRTDGDQISHQGWKKGEWGNGHLGQTSPDWKQVMQMAK